MPFPCRKGAAFSLNGWLLTAAAAGLLCSFACKKYEDKPGQYDPRLSSKYCNDPAAVNYNYGFPGTPDNSICYYPADVFAGSYSFSDSIFEDGKRIAVMPVTLHIAGHDQTKLDVTGFCASGDALRFTAGRNLFAYADTVVGDGQILCRPQDTVSGTLSRTFGDSLQLRIFLTVVSDTGTVTHQGTAYRQ
jgi:hypothetical protein